jgi:hypothetical protein
MTDTTRRGFLGGLLLAVLLASGPAWMPGAGRERSGRGPPVRRLDEDVVARTAHWAG